MTNTNQPLFRKIASGSHGTLYLVKNQFKKWEEWKSAKGRAEKGGFGQLLVRLQEFAKTGELVKPKAMNDEPHSHKAIKSKYGHRAYFVTLKFKTSNAFIVTLLDLKDGDLKSSTIATLKAKEKQFIGLTLEELKDGLQQITT